MNQELLILQFQEKDLKAYKKLYNLYFNNISSVVNNIVKNESEAFGITLESSDGSISPNLELLYTLGAVSS